MSRRWRYPRSRRAVFLPVISQPVQPQPPSWTPPFSQSRSRRWPAARPRHLLWTPSQPDAPIQARPRQRTVQRSRRGAFFAVVPAPVVVAPPAWPPSIVGHGRPKMPPGRRGRFFAVPGAAQQPPVQPNRRVRLAPVRRSRIAWPVPVQATATPPAWAPDRTGKPKTRLITPRRGTFFEVPPPQVVVTPPVWTPDRAAHNRSHVYPARRGRFLPVIAPQAAPAPPVWVPVFTARRRPVTRVARRARFGQYQPSQNLPPQAMRHGPVRSLAQRRGHFARPPWPQATPSQPGWCPQGPRGRRSAAPTPRRGRFLRLSLVGVLPPSAPATRGEMDPRARTGTEAMSRTRSGAASSARNRPSPDGTGRTGAGAGMSARDRTGPGMTEGGS